MSKEVRQYLVCFHDICNLTFTRTYNELSSTLRGSAPVTPVVKQGADQTHEEEATVRGSTYLVYVFDTIGPLFSSSHSFVVVCLLN